MGCFGDSTEERVLSGDFVKANSEVTVEVSWNFPMCRLVAIPDTCEQEQATATTPLRSLYGFEFDDLCLLLSYTCRLFSGRLHNPGRD